MRSRETYMLEKMLDFGLAAFLHFGSLNAISFWNTFQFKETHFFWNFQCSLATLSTLFFKIHRVFEGWFDLLECCHCTFVMGIEWLELLWQDKFDVWPTKWFTQLHPWDWVPLHENSYSMRPSTELSSGLIPSFGVKRIFSSKMPSLEYFLPRKSSFATLHDGIDVKQQRIETYL